MLQYYCRLLYVVVFIVWAGPVRGLDAPQAICARIERDLIGVCEESRGDLAGPSKEAARAICATAAQYAEDLCRAGEVPQYDDVSVCSQRANLIARAIFGACGRLRADPAMCRSLLEGAAGRYYVRCVEGGAGRE